MLKLGNSIKSFRIQRNQSVLHSDKYACYIIDNHRQYSYITLMEEKKNLDGIFDLSNASVSMEGLGLCLIVSCTCFLLNSIKQLATRCLQSFQFCYEQNQSSCSIKLAKINKSKVKICLCNPLQQGLLILCQTRQRTIVGDEIVIITNNFSSVLHIVKANLMSRTEVTLQPQRRKGRPLNVVNAIVTLPKNKQILDKQALPLTKNESISGSNTKQMKRTVDI